jgi:hypothetical protein
VNAAKLNRLRQARSELVKDARIWIAVVALAVASWLIAPFVIPPRAPAVAEDLIPQIHYVCKASGEVFTLPLSGDVAENPKTGEPTLVPAVYDSRKKKWRPGPPLEVMHRQGLLKPAS